LQCVAVCCSVLQCVVVCCSVLQCVAVCCSVAVRCNECEACADVCSDSPSLDCLKKNPFCDVCLDVSKYIQAGQIVTPRLQVRLHNNQTKEKLSFVRFDPIFADPLSQR